MKKIRSALSLSPAVSSTLCLCLAGVLVSCGSDSPGPSATEAELHTCELLPAADVGRLAGDTVASANTDVESSQGKSAVSQCTFTFAGDTPKLSVQIRRSGIPVGESRQADAARARESDDGTGFGIEQGDAIAAGSDVRGIGDLAYTYQIWESVHLVAYWDTYYTVWLWTHVDPDQKDRALQLEKAVAQLVIDKF